MAQIDPKKPRRFPPKSVLSVVFGLFGLTFAQFFGPFAAVYFGKEAEAAYNAAPHRYRANLGRVGIILGYAGFIVTGLGLAYLIVSSIVSRLT
jgi:hypothetical protein